ncbi:MAG: TolC family protein [Cyanobacteria bacterium SZAS LIN-5]|nr:TolC family protein [Cyanobacteria bacterium SZAS LIN-5]
MTKPAEFTASSAFSDVIDCPIGPGERRLSCYSHDSIRKTVFAILSYTSSLVLALFPNACLAENSGLTGLGEPAAPGSLRNPSQVMPSDHANESLNTPTGTVNPLSSNGAADLRLKMGSSGSQPVSLSQPAAPLSDSSTPSPRKDKAEPIFLKPRIEQTVIDKPFTLRGAVEYAQNNYPNILKGKSQIRAAERNVTVQKLTEYMPDSLLQYQELYASHNKLTQVFFGSPVFPAISGPAKDTSTLSPYLFSAAGVSLDWAPLDFGLHKARIQLAKRLAAQTKANYNATELDVGLTTANAFLDSVIAIQQVKAAEQNVRSFEQFSKIVEAQVNASLKPGADESLALAQLANARNDLVRAEMSRDLAFANLANSMGLGGRLVDIDSTGIADRAEPAQIQRTTPVFEEVPILQAANATVLSAIAQKKVLDKEYYPVFHLLGGFNFRSSALSPTIPGKMQSTNLAGALPVIPNYQLALIINWNFLDIFRLHQEKKVQQERIYQQQQESNLVLQNLRTQDLQSRARVKAALALAENMPVQVHASEVATQQAEARYRTGLGSVAQVAQANEVLAQSRVQDAIAKVGVWRALLSVASSHGDLRPLLSESDRIQKGL